MPVLQSGTILELFRRKSSKSPEIDTKSDLLRPENPKTDPFRADSKHLASCRNRTDENPRRIFGRPEPPFFPRNMPVWALLGHKRILGSTLPIQLYHDKNGRFHYLRPLAHPRCIAGLFPHGKIMILGQNSVQPYTGRPISH